jgi:hypothetical protein
MMENVSPNDLGAVAPTHPDPFPDGLYFGMEAAAYHADTALGSGDMKRLAANPVAWWYGSKLNPRRPADRDTPAMRFGRAVHCMVIEGRAAFERQYAPTEYPGNVKAGKDERAVIAARGQEALAREDYDRALIAGTYIKSDPELAKAFHGGAGEVSVFWTENGIRKKARFDYLKVGSIVDLKSTYEQDELEFDDNCKRLIAKRRMYVQVAHYMAGRDRLGWFLQQGMVNGPHDPKWLSAVTAAKEYVWVWVFYQSGGAPETWGTYTDRASKLYDLGVSYVSLAEHNYKTFSEKFGTAGEPWVRTRKLERYQEDEQPEWIWR